MKTNEIALLEFIEKLNQRNEEILLSRQPTAEEIVLEVLKDA